MRPVLLQIGALGIPSYGVAVAAAFLVAIAIGTRSAERQAISVVRVLDLGFWVLVISLLASRLLFVLTHAGHYYAVCVAGDGDVGAARSVGRVLADCTRALQLWEGGLVFYGGLAGATLFSWLYLRRHRIDFFRVADLAVPLIALGHAIGRLGCFAAGCCYGSPTGSSWGVRFPSGSFAFEDMRARGALAAASRTPALHPTQLYEAAVELALFFVLTLRNAHRRYFGQTFVTYLAVYPSLRAVIELFRADPARRFVLALATPGLCRLLGLAVDTPVLISTSQAISLATLVGTALLWRFLRRRRAPADLSKQP